MDSFCLSNKFEWAIEYRNSFNFFTFSFYYYHPKKFYTIKSTWNFQKAYKFHIPDSERILVLFVAD